MSFDFVAIDFETANNNYSSACSIGLAAVKNNEITEKYYSLIQPSDLKFSDKNTEINGITADDVKDAPLFPEIWENIEKYFQNNMLIAHNAIFDMTVLKNCLLEYNLDIPNFDYLCSIPISTRACRGEKIGQSLKDRAAHFGIKIENHHNSLCDAEICAKLVLECVKIKKRKSFESYCNTYTSLPIKHFKDLKPQKEFKKSHSKFNRINIADIVTSKESFDTSHALYGKNVVFTGDLKTLDRRTAMQKVVDLGGIVKSGVSSKTDYLVVGVQDRSLVGDDGMSAKEEKAYELKEKGIDIQILFEDEFIKLL